MVKIQINKIDTNALLDSGCATSVITEKLATYIQATIDYVNPENCETPISANGSCMKVIGHTCLDVNIEGLIIPFNFSILKQITQPIILSVDFLEYTNAEIKWSKHTISFYEMVELPILEQTRVRMWYCL